MGKIMKNWARIVPMSAIGLALALTPAQAQKATPAPKGIEKIDHIILIYLENHSFDDLFGNFPGAEGLSKAGKRSLQVDKDGKPYKTLPPVIDTTKKPPALDPRFPADLPNRPFPINKYVPIDTKFGDLVHRFYHEQEQIDGGKMDRYALESDAAGLVMGYEDGSKLPLWAYAKEFTLADHFFHAAFGGSFLNHFWTICACTPQYDAAPAEIRASLKADGSLDKDGQVSPDGYAINTMFTVYNPHPASITDQT